MQSTWKIKGGVTTYTEPFDGELITGYGHSPSEAKEDWQWKCLGFRQLWLIGMDIDLAK